MTSNNGAPPDWRVYHGTGRAPQAPVRLPTQPPWRRFNGDGTAECPTDDGGESDRRLGAIANRHRSAALREVAMVNSMLYLGRPLLVTGRPGTGKSTLAYLVARELGLGPVLRWPIVSRTALKDGQYLYDAIGRVQAAGSRTSPEPDIGDFLRLGPLGTALLPYDRPRVLLIDELDKSDIDLPNDLLNVFEDAEFEIPELVRLSRQQPEVTVLTHDRDGTATVHNGRVKCRAFPVIIMTSNGEREFPPAFLRRCLQLHIEPPSFDQLGEMVAAQFGATEGIDIARLITSFLERSRTHGGLAADQLLNAVHMATELATSGAYQTDDEWTDLLEAIWRPLSTEEMG
ncbi:MAG: MoxR family ATPase [Kibdelosporangium sp.]